MPEGTKFFKFYLENFALISKLKNKYPEFEKQLDLLKNNLERKLVLKIQQKIINAVTELKESPDKKEEHIVQKYFPTGEIPVTVIY